MTEDVNIEMSQWSNENESYKMWSNYNVSKT
jgi:hypothetical protein